ncbi:MAG: outer membrane beta-barrel protein [Bacteroidales bacterium]|nr:outer membrane beta-barrel protein [Bacteroidales bacterium]
MKRFLLLFAISILTFANATAQKKTTVTGRVLDSESAEALSYATVQILKADTTSMIAGGTTNLNGYYNVKNVPAGQYVMKVSYIGYHNFFRQVEIKQGQTEFNGGTIILTPNSVVLEEAVIKGTLKQVEVKEDTLIFNADAFKVPEGSVLEELIKKIPGAEVGNDGSIKINGKTVSKILVEGKEFFSNDRNMAMKNLPSNIVEKVKTYDKQSDMAKMTGIDDGEEETVIDLSIKKGMKNGWFGSVDLGAGTKDRLAERININRFEDQTQYALVGSYNNTSGRGGGITKTGMGGLNVALERGKFEIGGNVRYQGSKTTSITKSAVQNFITTNASFSNSLNRSISKNGGFNGDFKIEWKPDSMTTLNFRPSFSVGNSSSNSTGKNATFNDDPYLQQGVDNPLEEMEKIAHDIKVNQNVTGNKSTGENYSFNGRLILNRRLNNLGRNFSVQLNGSYSNNENKSYSLSDVIYFQRNDSAALTYRYRTTPNTSENFTVGFNYTEPLIAKKLFLQTSYRFNYSNRHSDGKAYDMGGVDELITDIRNTGAGYLPWDYYNYLDDDLSRYTDNTNYIHNIDVQLRLVTNYINMNVGVNVQPQRQRMEYNYQGLDTIATRDYVRVSPTLNFRYRFNKQHTLRIRYRGNTSQPSITDLFNMTDNSNPLNIRMGNPDLSPSFSNNINIDWNNYLSTTMQSFTARLSFSNTLNAIESRTQYNEETGGRITQPTNVNGNWNINGNFGWNRPIFVDNFTFNTSTSASYSNNVGYIYQNNQSLKNTVNNLRIGESIRLNYRTDIWDASLFGNLNYSNQKSKLVPTNNRATYDFSYGASGNIYLENGFGFSTNISMSSRRGYSSANMNTNELIWNAQVSYRFLKGKAATVSLQAYDILSKRSNISRNISATMRSDTETNAIYSYVMAHFIYRFNMFGGRNANRGNRNGNDNDGGYMRRNNDGGENAGRGGFGNGERPNRGGNQGERPGGNMGGAPGGNMGGGPGGNRN